VHLKNNIEEGLFIPDKEAIMVSSDEKEYVLVNASQPKKNRNWYLLNRDKTDPGYYQAGIKVTDLATIEDLEIKLQQKYKNIFFL
jgi:phosphorylcholine metabolism protein LicD